jgi:hypothetical protein
MDENGKLYVEPDDDGDEIEYLSPDQIQCVERSVNAVIRYFQAKWAILRVDHDGDGTRPGELLDEAIDATVSHLRDVEEWTHLPAADIRGMIGRHLDLQHQRL